MANPRTIARIESRILERAAYCLQFEVNDPRASFITITRVKLSTDLSSGKVYYSVLGGESDKSKAQHMLDHAAGFIQRQVSRVLEMRRMPRLSFIFDASSENAADVARLIAEARERDMRINPKLREEAPVKPADPRAIDGGLDAEEDELDGDAGDAEGEMLEGTIELEDEPEDDEPRG